MRGWVVFYVSQSVLQIRKGLRLSLVLSVEQRCAIALISALDASDCRMLPTLTWTLIFGVKLHRRVILQNLVIGVIGSGILRIAAEELNIISALA